MRLVSALVVAVGLVLAGKFVGDGFRAGRQSDRYVSVKGIAEREVKADLVLWPLRFVVTGNDLAAVQAKSRADADAVRRFLTGAGVPAEAIEVQGVEVTDVLANAYRSGPVDTRFIVAQTLLVRSTDVDRIAGVSQRVGELVDAGVVLSSEGGGGPYYLFTKLNDVKPAMIAEATKRAREGAEQFAADSGSRVGGIRRASQGLFQILPRDDTPGTSEQRQINKTVRVVSTVDYLLVD
ncbi:MAG TPA: SIMPL domain-containing protein [Candidatus Limnocylindria bacterium]|nr:SIMPL domain-containing protein [Candidatus Limnocylindria bacterium]